MREDVWQGTPPSSGDDSWLLDLSQPNHVLGHHQDNNIGERDDNASPGDDVGRDDTPGDDVTWMGTPPTSGDDSWLLECSQSGVLQSEEKDEIPRPVWV